MAACDILVLSDYAGSGAAAGGAGVAVLESFHALQGAGLRVRLLTGIANASDEPGIESLGGEDLRAGSSVGALRTVYNPASRRALAGALAQADPDRTIVILHQWTRYLTPSAIALLRPYRLMIYLHDYFWACPTGNYFDFRRSEPCTRMPGRPRCIAANCDRAGYAHKLVRLARHATLTAADARSRHARVHLHISESARAVAEPLLPHGRHGVVYNPLKLPTEDASQPDPASGARYQVGYFGRLEPEKGIAVLLRHLRARGMTGLFVGEGSLAAEIERVPGMVRLPWQDKANVTRLMRDCGAVALPSLWPETWGLVAAEAMAAGVPVIVSARAGSAELVRRFGGGLVCDPDDDRAFGDALDRVAAGTMPPLDAAGLTGLQTLLSPEQHAATIVRLAGEAWNVDVAR